jgi:hypothetical protein
VGAALDGVATQARGAAREGAECLGGRTGQETPEEALHAGEGAGKRERPAVGPCGGESVRGAVR